MPEQEDRPPFDRALQHLFRLGTEHQTSRIDEVPGAAEVLSLLQSRMRAEPEAPDSRALRDLLGLTPGLRHADAQRRQRAASAHLRRRRPPDDPAGAAAPLATRQQKRAFSALRARLTHAVEPDYLLLSSSDQTGLLPGRPYRVAEIHSTSVVDAAGRVSQSIERWTIEALDDHVGYFTKSSKWEELDDLSSVHLEVHGAGDADVLEQYEGFFSVTVRLQRALRKGERCDVGMVWQFPERRNGLRHMVFISPSPADRICAEARFAHHRGRVDVRRVGQAHQFDDGQFGGLTERVPIDHYGVAQCVFDDLSPRWAYGLAWRFIS
jgi:hypothetical protein